ncbi:MAG TPA: DUF2232 domain-containing protein [Longimicrobiales bacterium]|nr:DUF2232 domain-containing protein [Longimicrobiales bacterium]
MTAAQRARGWGTVAALALATAFLSVVQPALLMFVPLALLFLALPPRRPLLLASGLFICWLAFTGDPGANELWYFERGWALLLGAWFVLIVALLPRWTFLPRALGALAATAATVTVFLLVNRGGFAILDGAVSTHLRWKAAQVLAVWQSTNAGASAGIDMGEMLYRMAELQGRLFPALLALASLAGLGVAWWAFGRVGQGIAQPLARWREFRFRDELVWLLIAAVALMLLPVDQLAARAGENLLMFMAVLYALRGAAVLLVIGGAPGPLGVVVAALLVLFLTPFVMATTFLVGLSDTWLDIRARRQASSTPGS